MCCKVKRTLSAARKVKTGVRVSKGACVCVLSVCPSHEPIGPQPYYNPVKYEGKTPGESSRPLISSVLDDVPNLRVVGL